MSLQIERQGSYRPTFDELSLEFPQLSGRSAFYDENALRPGAVILTSKLQHVFDQLRYYYLDDPEKLAKLDELQRSSTPPAHAAGRNYVD